MEKEPRPSENTETCKRGYCDGDPTETGYCAKCNEINRQTEEIAEGMDELNKEARESRSKAA